ncbi:hypothetical protein [Sneathiella sp. HT1-7]|jgi:outer membrane lipoprotein SlyB|uniref:hypothetical protein n=1 Tax=Sneathiella sp. HT1-7 TaxID=2887192 RepID=UPI001D148A00|nr:hypothetical protein [Sneathiella sp. HT1-7]MCC3305894.1 hypothetical protein [Sneathiella sp. HT1-7]
MSSDQVKSQAREAVAVFDKVESLQAAIDELESSGFDRADLSLLAGETTVEEKLGHAYTKVAELEDNPDVPTIAYIPTESIGEAEGALIGTPMYIAAATTAGIMAVAGGPIALTIAAVAAAGAAGGLIGTVLATFLDKHHADYLQDQLDHGGLVLWVRARDEPHGQEAVTILKKHSAHDVHLHGVYA